MPDPMLFPVPSTFETSRLTMRSFRTGDAPALFEALAESIKDLRAYLWFLPWLAEEPTLQTAEVRCRTAEAKFLLRSDLAYLVFGKVTGRLVGSVGLHRTDWTLPKTEVGYWIRTSETGKGYASEAVGAITSWALEVLEAKRVELVTDEQNIGSRAVAERCGFRLEGILHNVMQASDNKLHHSCVYAKLRTELKS